MCKIYIYILHFTNFPVNIQQIIREVSESELKKGISILKYDSFLKL